MHPREVAGATPDERVQPLPHELDLIVGGARPVEPAVAQDRAACLDDHVLEVVDRFIPSTTSSGSSSVLTHPPSRIPLKMAALCATKLVTPVASAAASRWSVPSLRSRLVVAKKRSGFLRLGLPACASERPVIWCTIASGRAAATASPTDAAPSPSITTPLAPSCCSKPSLAALVVVAVTWWPRATSRGTSRRPMTPVPPATNTRITSRSQSGTGSRPRDETARQAVTWETAPRTSVASERHRTEREAHSSSRHPSVSRADEEWCSRLGFGGSGK